MNEVAKLPVDRSTSVLMRMAERFGMQHQAFEQVLRSTVVPANCSKEQFAAFLLVADEYKLNPITKEIYAFPTKGGGIQPIVGVDGWMSIINDHPDMDGMEFVDRFEDGELKAITCKIYRKSRAHQTEVTEYMDECYRETDAWKKWPARMLRHKAAIQCGRYAFGFSGIIDPDEYERGVGANLRDVSPPPAPVQTVEHAVPQPAKPRLPPRGQRSNFSKPYGHDETTPPPAPVDPAVNVEVIDHETGEVVEPVEIDGDKYLDDLEAKLAGAKTAEDIAEIATEHAAYRNDLMEPDQDKADKLIDAAIARISARSEKKK